MSHDVFLSFSFADQPAAEEIVNALTTKYGITCWICTREIDGGARYKRLIPEAIRTAKVVVFLQSETAVKSKEIPKEIGLAFDSDKTIIPFKIDSAPLQGDLEYDLYGVEYIDATVPTKEQRIHDLAVAIGKAIGKPIVEKVICSDPITRLQSKNPTCSRCFFGREDLLTNIHKIFADGNRIVFLRGMGGIGKSEIAKQYAKMNSDTYKTVVFARYTDSLVKLIADDTVFYIDGITRQTKENKEVQTDVEYADEKVKFLCAECKKDTLIIIDNYDVEYDPYLEELEKSGEYRLLITTRCDPKDSRYVVLSVTEITDQNALKDIVISYCSKEYVAIDKNDPAFGDLFDLTMRHTLALELIAQYMEETSSDLNETVKILRHQGLQQLSEASIIRQNKNDNAYAVIKRLFGLSSLSESEKQFLRFLCLMPDTGIERQYFKKWCDRDTFLCQSHLIKRSIVKYDGESGKISMHPLIREVVMSELTPNYIQCSNFLDLFADELVDYIAWNYPIAQKNSYFECCKSIQKFIPGITKETFNLWFHMTNFSCFVDTFDNNLDCLQHILQEAENLFGYESAWVGKILHRLGWCYYVYGNYKQALSILESKAYPVLNLVIHEAPGEYIHCCCDIAKLYFKDNVMDVANRYLQKAFDVINDEEILSCFEIVRYRSIMVYITKMLFTSERGDYDHALEYCKKSMGIANSLRYTELDQSTLLHSLARTYMKTADYTQAIEHIQKAIKNMEAYSGMLNVSCSQGERHCMLYIDLTECYEKTNDIESAKRNIAEAYKIADKIYCKGHPIHSMVEEKYDFLNKSVS